MKILLLLFFPLFCSDHGDQEQKTIQQGFAVIELFTSEGCSSCPPADNLVKQVAEQYNKKNVLILSYHVDYWDRLGWQDRFSSAANTERQKYYADIFHLESIYTPQIVVNGEKEFVGSDKEQLYQSIKFGKQNRSIKVIAKAGNNKIDVSFSDIDLKKDEHILVALVQKEALTQVKKGENEGRELHHVNIVSDFKILSDSKSSIEFKWNEKNKDGVFIATLVQNKISGTIDTFAISKIN